MTPTLMLCVEADGRAAALARVYDPHLLREAATQALSQARQRAEHAALMGPELQRAAVQQAEQLERILARVTKRCRRAKENA